MGYYGRASERETGWGRIIGGAAAGGILFLFGGISRCSADSEGTNNYFKMRGSVVAVSDHEIETRITSIDEAKGKAAGMLVVGQTITVYDEFNEAHIFDCNWEDVGRLTNIEGQTIQEEQLQPGQRVELEGHVRDHAERCDKRTEIVPRAVYDQGAQIPG